MSPFDILALICGLCLFLYGMDSMGDALKRSAGSRLKTLLAKMTSNPFKGFLLGLGVTAIIQSSSATTVMVVGFVNSGTMALGQAVGVIIGANVGTAVTSWLTGLAGVGAGETLTGFTAWLKPSAWMPILALIGIILNMFSKKSRNRDIGAVLLGFAVLMTGMEMMSDAVAPLSNDEGFCNLLTMFENPVLGVLAGLVLTAVIQSSSASVGILQSVATTGAITTRAAIPIIMGQNIGTCVTALLSSMGTNKNGRRAALVHLFFNILSTAIFLTLFLITDALVELPFLADPVNVWGIASIHTVFKLAATAIFLPMHRQLEKLACLCLPEKENEVIKATLLDDRLFETPAIAVERAEEVTQHMAVVACDALLDSIRMCRTYDDDTARAIRESETRADIMEDEIGSYLVRLSAQSMDEGSSHDVTKLLRLIGDFERISDHAVNLLESVEEMRDKKMEFSQEAKRELDVLMNAVSEIITLSRDSFVKGDLALAARIEALEQHIDDLRDEIKLHHILRLRKSECTIEHGFILSDMLNSLERVADHCSNIAGCVIEIGRHDALDMHRYLGEVKRSGADFDRMFGEYRDKYAL